MPLEPTDSFPVHSPQGTDGLALEALGAMAAAVYITDANGTIEWVNPSFSRLTGWPADEAVGMNPRILQSGFQDHQYYARFWEAIGMGHPTRTHIVNQRRSGQLYVALQSVTPLCDADGKPHHFIALQEELPDDELPAFDQLPVAVVGTDTSARIRVWNRAAEAMLGWDAAAVRGQSLVDTVVPDEARKSAQALVELASAGVPGHGELQLVRKDDSRFVARLEIAPQRDQTGTVTGLIAAAIDITEELEVRESLAHAERVAQAGRLAVSIAHDFNNILTAISLQASMAATELDDGHAAKTDLQQIGRAVDRAMALTGRLVAFSRRRAVASTHHLDLNSLILDLRPLLDHVVRKDIQLDLDLGQDVNPILADASQVEQVIVNLVVNARDAMPDGGRVTIATSMDRRSAERSHGVVEVRDTGVGIEPSILGRIFEPFFTTKGDAGTGLGLATVHSIVVQSGGGIDVASEPGSGTLFRVSFPAAEQ